MIRLLIDAGNTRIKLAWVIDENWSPVVAVPCNLACDLNVYFDEYCGAPVQQVWVSNVAGDEVARLISAACELRQWQVHFVTSEASRCGVRNSYDNPAQLGSDRWAALIAAWYRVGGACLVVSCGTATTIDALSCSGEFMGGLILPGMELMQRSLSAATAQLRPGEGKYADFPRNTADALYSGAIQAGCGAIQRQLALLDGGAPVLLSGGAAHLLLPHLTAQMTDNLVLQGLLLIAKEAGEA